MNLRNLLLCSFAFAVAGCATMKAGSLEKNSARLEDQSREFYSEVRSQAQEGKEVTPVTRAAESLILSTRDFNRAVGRRAKQQQVMTEFDHVARDYKLLTESLAKEGHGGRTQEQADKFELVKDAYQAVERSLPAKQAAISKEPATNAMQLSPAQLTAYTEIERRTKIKDYWFP